MASGEVAQPSSWKLYRFYAIVIGVIGLITWGAYSVTHQPPMTSEERHQACDDATINGSTSYMYKYCYPWNPTGD